jgi:hypothetical protein
MTPLSISYFMHTSLKEQVEPGEIEQPVLVVHEVNTSRICTKPFGFIQLPGPSNLW